MAYYGKGLLEILVNLILNSHVFYACFEFTNVFVNYSFDKILQLIQSNFGTIFEKNFIYVS